MAVWWWQVGKQRPYPQNARKLEIVLGVPVDELLANETGLATTSDEAKSQTTATSQPKTPL
jgi:cytoskeletal protein RodZ